MWKALLTICRSVIIFFIIWIYLPLPFVNFVRFSGHAVFILWNEKQMSMVNCCLIEWKVNEIKIDVYIWIELLITFHLIYYKQGFALELHLCHQRPSWNNMAAILDPWRPSWIYIRIPWNNADLTIWSENKVYPFCIKCGRRKAESIKICMFWAP